MALNTAQQELIARRRERVAQMRLRGMTQRQIAEELPRARQLPNGKLVEGITDPKTGKPFSLGTINADIKALQQEWRESAARDTQDIMAELLAELDELKRAAWAEKNHKLVRQVIVDQMKAHGMVTEKHEIEIPNALTDEQRAEQIAALIAKAQTRANHAASGD